MTKFPMIDLTHVQRISPAALELLWVNDCDEGPLEAVVEHEGQPCLMVLHSEDATTESYRWMLIRLTPAQVAEEQKWHELFVQHVGAHWCFHGSKYAHAEPLGEPEPERFEAAYKARAPIDVSGSVLVGWTDAIPTR